VEGEKRLDAFWQCIRRFENSLRTKTTERGGHGQNFSSLAWLKMQHVLLPRWRQQNLHGENGSWSSRVFRSFQPGTNRVSNV
jgi:hypothetical protein